jgi:putative ABC transport system permease protein
MERLLQDLHYGLRVWLKRPGFAAIAILALALGIGANTAIFSVVNSILLRPLPFKDPDRIMYLAEKSQDTDYMNFSWPDYQDWRDQNSVFEQMALFKNDTFTLSGTDQPEQVTGGMVTGNFFTTLGVNPFLGRNFLPEEDQPGANRTLILSHGLWQRRFGADPKIIGKTALLDTRSYIVVGVAPAGFDPPTGKAELWVPLGLWRNSLAGRSGHSAGRAIARLKPGVTVKQAVTEIDSIARRLQDQYKEAPAVTGATVLPLHEQVVGKFRPAILILFAAVGFVLLIACANVANLLLARSASRQREIAIRSAVGASRFRIIQQLLTEGMLLSLFGGILGLLLAMWGTDLLVTLGPVDLPRLKEIGIDSRALGFTLIASILTSILFGLAPALQASRPDLNETLKEGGKSSMEGMGGRRVRNLLVVTEVALTFVLLIGAGLMIKSFLRLQQVDPGYNTDKVLALEMSLPGAKYRNRTEVAQFYEKLFARIEAIPGIEASGGANNLPMGENYNQQGFSIEGGPIFTADDYRMVDAYVTSPGYFRAMGIPLLRGRIFSDQDRETSPPVGIIDEAMARIYWPDADPIGKHFKMSGSKPEDPWITVVGIVGSVKQYGLDQETRPQIYRPFQQRADWTMSLVVKAPNPMGLVSAIRQAVGEVDKDQPIYNIKPLEQIVAESTSQRRFNMLLLVLFAVIALILAAVGIYGVMSYSVTQRTHEIGIRMALGADQKDILKLILGHGMALALAGIVIGMASALALTRLMSSLLFGVSATDLPTFAVISIILTGIALLSCFIPARRAMKVDPMVALRYE